MTTSQLAVVVPIVVAAISFFAAVVAVVVGQLLGQRFQRSADERRWDREDVLRRRTRSEEMAREAIGNVAKASELLGWTAGYARGAAVGKERTYIAAPQGDVSDLCRPIRRAALEIDDEAVRTHLDKVPDLLGNASAIQGQGAPHPARIAWAVQETSEALISAYLRGVALSTPLTETQARAFKTFDDGYSAVEDLWDMLEDEED